MNLLAGALASFVAVSATAFGPVATPVNIFGDGEPANGVEDNRQQLPGGRGRGVSLADQGTHTGTVFCDGKVRGTAMVIDTREYAPGLEGAVLASAAHVIYDLDKKRRFKNCEFHFLALGEISRYRARIDLKQVSMGGFDPHRSASGLTFGEGDWVFLYVPEPWRNFDTRTALPLRDFAFATTEAFQHSGGEFRLVAFDSSTGAMSVSTDCTVIESRAGDLGGGQWDGQLLDDCDSAGGASGGGIVAVLDDHQYLIGIRNGSHWSAQAYPANQYPQGPPNGSVWDRRSNTNFGRAIDQDMIRELEKFCKKLKNKNNNI